MTVLVTGGAGFIGSNFVLEWIKEKDEPIINLDKLTYAGNLNNLNLLKNNPRHIFSNTDICNREEVSSLLENYKPRAIINFAAESHVDRSIQNPEEFITTNVVGTFRLLDTALDYWQGLSKTEKVNFRFVHISTDEVYGALQIGDPQFNENTSYKPNSPYSATKASSDHLVRSYFHTYELPVITTNCSNNYGPYQFPEKLIPLIIQNALTGLDLPIYGDGKNIRDWLYVTDHCSAIRLVLEKGRTGETYNIGGKNEISNLEIVKAICSILDRVKPKSTSNSYSDQITFVKDRPGHDYRYAIDPAKIEQELGWYPQETLESGLQKTVEWYLNNEAWLEDVTSGRYKEWVLTNYKQRSV